MNIRQDKLDGLVIDKIGEYIFRNENIPIITKKLLELNSNRNAEYQNCVKRIKKRIQSNRIKLENIANAIADGCDIQAIRDKLKALEDERTALESTFKEAENKFRSTDITEQIIKNLQGKFKAYMSSHNTVAY